MKIGSDHELFDPILPIKVLLDLNPISERGGEEVKARGRRRGRGERERKRGRGEGKGEGKGRERGRLREEEGR